jgi:hypothetical protein
MNRKSVQFKSAKEREQEANICKHYRAIGIQAVVAATALSTKKKPVELDKKRFDQR